ncbi:MAG: Crp/Fnr family transcriptional regulator [Bacillota bacterium]
MKYVISSPGKLKEYEMEILRDCGSECQYKRGQYIFRQGDDSSRLCLIETGAVRLSRPPENPGREVVSVRTRGDLLGLDDVFYGKKMTCTARAISDVSVLSVRGEDLLEILDCDPFLLNSIIHLLSHHSGVSNARSAEQNAKLSSR